jgi:transcription elongation factor Elf1
MMSKKHTCKNCGHESFGLEFCIFTTKRRNHLLVKCESCEMSIKIQIGDKK